MNCNSTLILAPCQDPRVYHKRTYFETEDMLHCRFSAYVVPDEMQSCAPGGLATPSLHD